MWRLIYFIVKWILIMIGAGVMIYHYNEDKFVLMMITVLVLLRSMNDDLQDEIKKKDVILKGLRENNSKLADQWRHLREKFNIKVH